MKPYRQLQSVGRILRSRLTGKRIPVALRWNLLNACACRCEYCNLWRSPGDTMETDEILPVLRQFAELGTTRVSFSGGEPLLRRDLGRIVDEAARLDLSPTMNTSGYGLKKRIAELSNLELLKVSIDGPEPVHDRSRGRQGAHAVALEALELGRARMQKVAIATTITRHNVNHLGYMLDLSREFDTVVAFQPIKRLTKGVKNLESVSPTTEALREAVQMLIREKRAGHQGIRNSLPELNHMLAWPDYPPLRCGAGRIFVMVSPDGTLLPCDRIGYARELPNVREMSVAEGLKRLPNVDCAGCAFCGSLQLNMLYSMTSWPIREVLRLVN
jgi:MoaA/NifB/PqqE/SkfB family radical SAM enzyme